MANKKNSISSQHELVLCDLNFPRLQNELLELESTEFDQVEETVKKIEKMTWDQVYKTSSKTQKRGINWKSLKIKSPSLVKRSHQFVFLRNSELVFVVMANSCDLFRFIQITIVLTMKVATKLYNFLTA